MFEYQTLYTSRNEIGLINVVPSPPQQRVQQTRSADNSKYAPLDTSSALSSELEVDLLRKQVDVTHPGSRENNTKYPSVVICHLELVSLVEATHRYLSFLNAPRKKGRWLTPI